MRKIGVGEDRIREVYEQEKNYAATGRVLGISRQRVHQVIADYHNYGTKRLSDEAKALLLGKCELCEINRAKNLHHRDYENSNDDISNLQPVCIKCHAKLHRIENSKRPRNGIKYGQPCYGCDRKLYIEVKHSGRGLCESCSEHLHNPLMGYMPTRPEKCNDCGLVFTDDNYHSVGKCFKCYFKNRYHTNLRYREQHKEIMKKTYLKRKARRAIDPEYNKVYLEKMAIANRKHYEKKRQAQLDTL